MQPLRAIDSMWGRATMLHFLQTNGVAGQTTCGLLTTALLLREKGSVIFGHGIKRLHNGLYRVAPGWGGVTHIHFKGNTFSGGVSNWPGQLPAPGKISPRPADMNWSSEPMFNPRHPLDYPAYLKTHHAWMVRLFQKAFPNVR